MRNVAWVSLTVLGLGLAGCEDKKSTAEPPAPATSASAATAASAPAAPSNIKRLDFPGTEEGAKAMLESFIKPGADHAALTKSLRPDPADYQAIFVEDAVMKARTSYDEQWNANAYEIKGNDDQTEIMLWKVTTEQLRENAEPASQFPGGYKKVADKLKPGLTFYRFKFVRPEDKHGATFDGLVHVNGHWVLVSKPYRVL